MVSLTTQQFRSEFDPLTNTPYLTFTCELLDVFREYFVEMWPQDIESTLHGIISQVRCTPTAPAMVTRMEARLLTT